MSRFRDTINSDIGSVFLNPDEFAEEHSLNGVKCLCITQKVVINDTLTASSADDAKYTDGLYGFGFVINVKKSDLGYVPRMGEVFLFDDLYGHVVTVADDMGVLTITWAANES